MKEEETKKYNGYEIFLNNWEEYCVCHLEGKMVEPSSSFKTEQEAKNYIKNK